MEVIILNGTDDLTAPFSIRETVFTKEQGFQNPDVDAFDTVAFHVLFCEDDKRPIATGRCFPEEDNVWHIGRVCVLREARGRDLGRLLMRALEREAAARGARQLILGAQLHAVPFYEKCGFVPTGKRFMDEFCEHEWLEKSI